MQNLETKSLFDLSHTAARALLEAHTYPWEALTRLSDFIRELGKTLPPSRYVDHGNAVLIAVSASVSPSALINGPCIIGENAEIRQGALIRESVIVGANAVVGNSCELKNCILFDGVQVPHFNYVGDSILGHRAHMGAGSITSNVKSDKTDVAIRFGNTRIVTGMRKLGAIIGDGAEIGCNCVLNPGTVIGSGSSVYPLTSVRGYVPNGHIVKSETNIVKKHSHHDRESK